jgi:type VI secretion system secreted protein Hcp
MPITGFLKIPDIDGESQRVDHEDEIDIHAMEWGVSQVRPAMVGRGRARARSDMKPMRVSKYYDASSPYLAQAADRAKSFDEVVVSVRKDSGEAHLDYLIITMENVIITSYALKTGDPDEIGAPLSEEVEFDFEKVTILYKRQADDGSVGSEHEVTLDT